MSLPLSSQSLCRLVPALFFSAALLSSCEKKVPTSSVLTGKFREVEPFALTDQQSRPLANADLKGRVWIANFIFSSCNAECLILSSRFAELQRLFADEPGVAFVSFSVDPQTDTPERLGQFAQRWHADPERWYFLTGDSGKLDALIKNSFLLPVTRDPMEAGKLLTQKLIHTNRFAIVDRAGTVKAYVDGLQPESVSVISRLVLEMLRESPDTETSETPPTPRT
jgi:protein SCO1/2